MTAPKLLLDFQELADAVGLHLATIYRMKDRHELPVPIVHLGRSPRVRLVDVEAWLAQLAEDADGPHPSTGATRGTNRLKGSSRSQSTP